MRTYESFLALVAELDGDTAGIARLRQQNIRAWERIQAGATDVLDWGPLGFTLHTLYGVAENYFLRISKFFENNLSLDRWHTSLVEKMALEIPRVRPSFFSTQQDRRDGIVLA